MARIRTGASAPPRRGFDPEHLRALHQAVLEQRTLRIEARDTSWTPTGMIGALPPTLFPQAIRLEEHDARIAARLPAQVTESPSIEYIVHTDTTGTPAVTPEGQGKPEVVYNLGRQILPMTKIAAHTGASWESLNDWLSFQSYVTTELAAQVVDTENTFVLSGDGDIKGLANTVGVLPHAVGLGETPLDAIEMSITELRVGSAKAVADFRGT